MLAISQTSSGYYCLEWSSTETGPRIVNCKHISLSEDLESDGALSKLLGLIIPIQKEETQSISITLNNNNYLISQLEYDSKIGAEKFINWYENKILSKDFLDSYDLYYYKLYKQNTFLTLSIRKKIKNQLIDCTYSNGYNLLYLSADIFSAAVLVNQLNKFNEKDDYYVWKVGKNNYHYIIHYINNEINTFLKLKKTSNNLKSIIEIGDKDSKSKILDFLYSILIKKKKFNSISNVFIYQTSKNYHKINKLLKIDKKNISLIDFTKISKELKNHNLHTLNSFSENGISFWGIDV